MSIEEAEKRIEELSTEYSAEKSLIRSKGAPKNSGRMRETRRTIARLKTHIREINGKSKTS